MWDIFPITKINKQFIHEHKYKSISLTQIELDLHIFFNFFLFSTRPPPGLLPVLGPLGSGTDATHQPSPALRLLGYYEASWSHKYS